MTELLKSLIKSIFEHSTARAFFIFSAGLVIISLINAQQYVPIAFFTLFYAFLAYRIVVLRRTEGWGDSAVKTYLGAGLYFIIDWGFFTAWVAGTILLLDGYSLYELTD